MKQVHDSAPTLYHFFIFTGYSSTEAIKEWSYLRLDSLLKTPRDLVGNITLGCYCPLEVNYSTIWHTIMKFDKFLIAMTILVIFAH